MEDTLSGHLFTFSVSNRNPILVSITCSLKEQEKVSLS